MDALEKKGELKRALIILVFMVLLTLLFVSASRLGLTGFGVLEKSCLINADCQSINSFNIDNCTNICKINHKIYKDKLFNCINSLRTASMIPGDRKVAGCFNFSNLFGGTV